MAPPPQTFSVRFVDDDRAPVEVAAGRTLSEELNAKNSPVLFGCRTGICGTCVVEVAEGAAGITPADEDEEEILELYRDGRSSARLACQIDVQADLALVAHCQKRWDG